MRLVKWDPGLSTSNPETRRPFSEFHQRKIKRTALVGIPKISLATLSLSLMKYWFKFSSYFAKELLGRILVQSPKQRRIWCRAAFAAFRLVIKRCIFGPIYFCPGVCQAISRCDFITTEVSRLLHRIKQILQEKQQIHALMGLEIRYRIK